MSLLLALACAVPEPVMLGDAGNYAFEGGLDIVTREVAAQADLLVDWGGLGLDLQGHELDPTQDVAMATLLAFSIPRDEVVEGLSGNELDQADVALFVTRRVEPEETAANISEFRLLGNDIDVEENFTADAAEVWMLLVQGTTTPGVGTHQIMFLDVSDTSDTDSVSFTDQDAVLDFQVDLDTEHPLVPRDQASVQLDWSELATDGLGQDFVPGKADSMMLARYDESPEQLAEQFLDLELIAEDLYELDLEGDTSVDTALVPGFQGFTREGTWVMALRCSTCTNPAPLYLSVLEVSRW